MKWIKNKTLKRDWFGTNPKLGLYLLLGWLASLSTFFLSLMVGWFYDIHFQEEVSKSTLLMKLGLRVEGITSFFSVMGMVIFLKFLLQLAERKGINGIADRFIYHISGKLYRKQINWEPEIFSSRPFGKYLLRYSGDMSSIRGMLVNGIHRGIRDGLFLISGLGILLWINPIWTAWLLAIAMLASPLFLLVDRLQFLSLPEKQNSKNELLNYVAASFARQKQIFDKGNSEYNFRGFRRRNKRVLAAADTYQKWESLRHAMINVSGPLLVMFLLGIIYFSPSPSSPGQLLTFLLVLAATIPAFRNLVKAPNLIQKGLLSLEKIEKLIAKKPETIPKTSLDEKIVTLPIIPQALEK